MVSSFNFRTPTIPTFSNEFPSPPVDVNFSVYIDDLIIPSQNLIHFHYIPDVLLNISSTPPILPYTGEELKLQVENLTEAAAISDIQLLIGCSECKLKTFTSEGITCQPPQNLRADSPIMLNNGQEQGEFEFNDSISNVCSNFFKYKSLVELLISIRKIISLVDYDKIKE